jgi:L-asparaginase
VLTSPGAELLARELGLPVADLVTPARRKRWYDRGCDTVGCLVRTASGQLYAGTSTGGRGYETPGRVSDSATVAGTYCTGFAAVSATGVGEEIVDDAVAARLETRRRDGLSLADAAHRCFEEAKAKSRAYGWIAADAQGFWSAVHTTPAMTYIVIGAEEGEVTSSSPGRA